MPPLRALEAFLQVGRTGSAKAAAAELALSAPALSRRLQALEHHVGRPLFDRGGQRIRLNADGEALFAAVSPALDQIADAVAELARLGQDELRLRLGCLPLFGATRLLPRLPELKKRYPKLHIDVDTVPHAETKLGDSIDAAIIITDRVDPKLYSVALDTNYVYAIGAVALAEGDDPLTRPEQLADHTILVHSDMPRAFDEWKAAIGLPDLEPQGLEHLNSGPLMLEAAAQGLGVAIMHGSHYSDANDPRLTRLFDVAVESPYSYWFVCRHRDLDNRAVRVFRDWVVQASL